MIVICEECGKKYQIDSSKIKGKTARSNCKACGQTIVISKPEVPPPQPPPISLANEITEDGSKQVEASIADASGSAETFKNKGAGGFQLGIKGLGLRSKMLILFVFVPIIMMAGAGFFYMRQMYTLSDFITNEGTHTVSKLAEYAIAENARSVAKQARLFLLSHPNLRREEFSKSNEFKKIAVQKVGKTGYSALYELPGPDDVWRTWAHVNPKIIGIDMKNLKKPLGKAFPGFWRVYTGVKKGKEAEGYYTWQDKDGSFRDKFMVCTPVEGTSYIIASTTYLDEFTMPMKKLEQRANTLRVKTRNINIEILAGTLVLIGLIVSLYGNTLISRIRHLTDVTERISVGELSAQIEVKTKDELGLLGEAISRMQDSIRLSMERLRRRR